MVTRAFVKKILPILLLICVLSLCVAITIVGNKQSPYDYLKNKANNYLNAPSELLYQETLDTGLDIVFYTDQRGLFNCGMTEQTFFGYKTVGISGSLGIYDDTYIYSAFADDQTIHNICWGVLTDNDVTEVLLDDEPCNIADTPYNFRVFWLTGLEIDNPASPSLPSLTKIL